MASNKNDNGDPTALLQFIPADIAIRAKKEGNDTFAKVKVFAEQLTHYVTMVETMNTGAASVGDDPTAPTNVGDDPTAAPKTNEVAHSVGEEEEEEEVQVAKQKAKDDESDGEDKSIRIEARKRQRTEEPCGRSPRKLEGKHSLDLDDSSLQRSVGRTRQSLNQHLASLGHLTAKFSQCTISKHGDKVSHITLQHKWNDLPKDASEPLEFWLGEGPRRATMASPLDPSKHHQSTRGIPIFWARPQTSGGGGALCHYVGHFQCVRFERCNLPVLFKGQPRQALLEFRFVRFDETLANKMALIPQDPFS